MPEERASKAMGELKAPIGPNTAHLCIDMQRLFSDEGPWPMAWMPRVTPKVEQLVARAPERTIFTRFIPPEKPVDAPGRWRAYYEKWSHVTRRQLDHRLIGLPSSSRRLAAHLAEARIAEPRAFGLLAPAPPWCEPRSSPAPSRRARHRCARGSTIRCLGIEVVAASSNSSRQTLARKG
jgi:hypothetical protein